MSAAADCAGDCFNHKTNITYKQAIIFFCVYIIDQSNEINELNISEFSAVW